jgi:hypothetical protein
MVKPDAIKTFEDPPRPCLPFRWAGCWVALIKGGDLCPRRTGGDLALRHVRVGNEVTPLAGSRLVVYPFLH